MKTITIQSPPPPCQRCGSFGSWPECGFSSPHVKCPDCNWQEYRESLIAKEGIKAWLDLRIPRENYSLRTAQDLEIADLKRENNAAFERIQELSQALVDLGFDPTAKI